ncbi:MAG TPA: glycine zipper 2TM domain-containing protein [Ramlibacter sp.]|nr:glycine zipper 2TM domain-containing protein [Ramlibacter sp.]
MRTSKRFAAIAAATVTAGLLAACGSAPMQPNTYPTTSSSSSFPSTTWPSSSPSASSSGTVGGQQAAVEWGRVTDIQTVQMGAAGSSSSTNPQVRNAVVGGIIGAVVGNVVGKKINDGDNRSAATVLGGAAGAAIGSRAGAGSSPSTASSGAGAPAYRVSVQTDQGMTRTYEVGALGDLRVGDRVRIENNVIYRS